MTIKCSQCGGVIVERCPKCNTKAEIKGRLSDCVEQVVAIAQLGGGFKKYETAIACWCGKCRRYFEQGAGGTKEKICVACGPKQQELLPCAAGGNAE